MFEKIAYLGRRIFGPENRRRGDATARRERRQGARYFSAAHTRVRRAGKNDESKSPARVRDVSQRGIGLVCPQPWDVGNLLHVDVPHGRDGFAELLICVIYSTPIRPGSWTVGCSFIRDLTAEEMQPFLPSKES